jgi:hypothetical protein
VLGAVFGWRSVVATALPTQGMAFYQTQHYGMFTTLKTFLFPDAAELPHGSVLRYYICDRATWWMLSTALLVVLSVHALVRLFQRPRLSVAYATVVVCGAVQVSFAVLAYGTPPQHVIYDPIVVIGVVIGLAGLTRGRLRAALLCVFVVVGTLGEINQATYTYSLWRDTRPVATANDLYTSARFMADWAPIAALSKSGRVLVLSYSTGTHHYFENIDSPDAWTLNLGQLFESDRQRLLTKISTAPAVAEDLTGVTSLFEQDADIRRELGSMCLLEANASFKVWTRRSSCPSRRSEALALRDNNQMPMAK